MLASPVQTAPEGAFSPAAADGRAGATRDALAQAASLNFQFIWRTVRRLGVRPNDAVDDAVQKVFEIASRKRERIAPGSERAFLYQTAVKVAAEVRRSARRKAERELSAEEAGEAQLADAGADPERATEQRRLRAALDAALDALDFDLRTVFVLFELEGLSGIEIARLLELPAGTVASRLRRARDDFRAAVRRQRVRDESRGGAP